MRGGIQIFEEQLPNLELSKDTMLLRHGQEQINPDLMAIIQILHKVFPVEQQL